MKPRIGVLALQGDFAAHLRALERAGAIGVEVRTPGDLAGCAGLVLPGGESTTLLKLLASSGLDAAVVRFHEEGGALFGTCAGAILLARETSPRQRTLGLIDVVVERNAYGRQRDSFEGSARPYPPLDGAALPMLFIRAPRIRAMGPGVVPLATVDGEPVLAAAGRVLIATGHPELTRDLRVHRLFLEHVLRPRRSGSDQSKSMKRRPVARTGSRSVWEARRAVP